MPTKRHPKKEVQDAIEAVLSDPWWRFEEGRHWVERILRDDAELVPVLPQILALVARVRYQRRIGPLLRDSVGWTGR